MIGPLCLALATSIGAIEAGWQPLDGGGLEYIIRIDPESQKELTGPLTHEIAPEASDIRRVLVFVGHAQLPRTPAKTAAKKSAARDSKGVIHVSAKSVDQLRTEGVLIEVPEEQRNATRVEISIGDNTQENTSPPETAKSDSASTPKKNPFEKSNAALKSDTSNDDSENAAGPELSGHNAPFPPDDNNPRAKSASNTDVTSKSATQRPPWSAGLETKKQAEVQTASHAQPDRVKESSFQASPSDLEPQKEPSGSTAEANVEEPSRPWLPLTAALLALFASLGGNVYLAWLNYDSRTRYRRLLSRMQEPAVTER